MPDSDIRLESRRARRYVVVRVVSRTGDIAIYAVFLFVFSLEWLVPAFAVSSLFNYTADFWGQKLWTFEENDKQMSTLWREFGIYFLIRGGVAGCALVSWYLLHTVLGVSVDCSYNCRVLDYLLRLVSLVVYRFSGGSVCRPTNAGGKVKKKVRSV